MRLPSLLEYQRAVQTPRHAFATVDLLRTGRPVLNAQGMPSVASGGFAATFKIQTATGDPYAVRCFHKQGQDDRNLPERYRHIGDFVATHPDLDCLIDVVYQDDGITVGGNRFPIVRMQWADGETLGVWVEDWIEDPRRDPAAIDTVRTAIASAVAALRQHGAAHGDLQHGNILVGDDLSIRLIDYDGMYLPAFAGKPHLQAIEQGHRNYQHPGRGTRYDADIDAFSAAVIDLSLRALQHRPDLWDDYGGTGENLIFTAADFVDPVNSAVFAELATIPDVAEAANRLQRACQVDYDHVPAALAGRAVSVPAAPVATGSAVTGDVIPAHEVDRLRRLQGQTVTVFGTIRFASVTKGRGGRDVALINLGNYENGDFTIVGYDAVAAALFSGYGEYTRNNKRVLRKLHGWRVSITGTIVLYEYKGLLVPQIELPRAGLLRNLPSDKVAALTAAAANRGTPATPRRPAATPQPPQPRSTAAPSTHTPAGPAAAPPQSAATPTDPAGRAAARAAGLHNLYKNFPTTPPPATAATPAPIPTPPSPAPSTPVIPSPSPHRSPPLVPPKYRREHLPRPRPQAVPVPSRRPAGRSHRRRRNNLASVGVLILLVAVLLGLLILRHRTTSTDPVTFQNASHTVACRLTASGVDAGIRCDTGEVDYTPPPVPPGCTEPGWGRTLTLTATTVGFTCTPPVADPEATVLADGATTTAGPYTCTSTGDTVACRDTRPGGHQFRIGRNAYEFN
ncbi:hypothetical protein [Nocardia transvalensis]|uniref:hypothetical protein n=1 Tax=Nocardia transvalensis TaxID=37333 RepID=UPI001895630D|nr:hypothetical protein [Nocardia transvalensis]MBF6333558.1 hypothetical protein [Nocardia transvalensis]